MFNLAISCLTTSNLLWFMDLTFQVPMQYCPLEHQIFLSSPGTSTTKRHFPFGQAASFFLELLVIALHPSPVAYWAPTNLGSSSFSVLSFCLFILCMGFSRQKYWSGSSLFQWTTFYQNSPPWPLHLGGLLQGWGQWVQQCLHGTFEGGPHYLPYLHHSLASGQITGREHSPTLQQKIGLKIYWASPYPSEQDPVSPQSVSPIRKLP